MTVKESSSSECGQCIVQALNWHTWSELLLDVFFQLAKMLRWSTINFSSISGSGQSKYPRTDTHTRIRHWLSINRIATHAHSAAALSICVLNNNKARQSQRQIRYSQRHRRQHFNGHFRCGRKGLWRQRPTGCWVLYAVCCTGKKETFH